MVIEEDVSPLNVFVLKNGLEPDRIWPQFFGPVEIVIAFVAMLVAPPFVEFSPVKSQVQQRAFDFQFLADGILELWLINERRGRVERGDVITVSPGSISQLCRSRIFGELFEQ